jgi:hypothetical protein
MPEFLWDPVDFLDVFGVAPIEHEDGCNEYKMPRQGVNLSVSIWPLDGDVFIKLTCDNQSPPLLEVSLLSCQAARVLQDKRGQYTEFASAKAFTGRYDETFIAPHGFRLWVNPFVQVEPFFYPV